jgi:hypothetical protein
MAPGRGVPQIDQALEAVVGAINALTEPQDGGPGVVLTLGGLVISGTIQQDQTVYTHLTEARGSGCRRQSTALLPGCTGEDGSQRFPGGRSAILALSRQPLRRKTPTTTRRRRRNIVKLRLVCPDNSSPPTLPQRA